MEQKIWINQLVVISDTIVIVHSTSDEGAPLEPTTIFCNRLVRLAKCIGNENLCIPAIYRGYGIIEIDMSQDFKGKREFMVSEVMNS